MLLLGVIFRYLFTIDIFWNLIKLLHFDVTAALKILMKIKTKWIVFWMVNSIFIIVILQKVSNVLSLEKKLEIYVHILSFNLN